MAAHMEAPHVGSRHATCRHVTSPRIAAAAASTPDLRGTTAAAVSLRGRRPLPHVSPPLPGKARPSAPRPPPPKPLPLQRQQRPRPCGASTPPMRAVVKAPLGEATSAAGQLAQMVRSCLTYLGTMCNNEQSDLFPQQVRQVLVHVLCNWQGLRDGLHSIATLCNAVLNTACITERRLLESLEVVSFDLREGSHMMGIHMIQTVS